ncbi:MAG: hypothetical protein ACI9LM_000220 [Alteromonadaceae bacterium]|jgi:hypothetical protein
MPASSVKVVTASRSNQNLTLLQPGSNITIDIVTPAGQKGKFRTCFIGYLPKKYILIQYPEASKLDRFSKYITQGTAITVRGLIEGHEGVVVAFVSSVKQTLQIPSRVIVLEFPQSVSLQNLRSSMRIDTNIVVKVKVRKEYWQAFMINISLNGCQLIVDNGESLVFIEDEKIDVIVEDFQGLKNINLIANVRSTKTQKGGIAVGVEFCETSKDSIKQLIQHAVIMEDDT